MFLCKPCHKKLDCSWDNHHSGSNGPCESCGKGMDCVDCHVQAKTNKRKGTVKKKVFGITSLKNNYKSLESVWKPFAEKAVDDTFKAVAENSNFCCEEGNTEFIKCPARLLLNRSGKVVGPRIKPALQCRVCKRDIDLEAGIQEYDDLEIAFWEQDTGFDTLDCAIEAIAEKLKQEVNPKIEDWVGKCPEFTEAWNKYQNVYAIKKYAIDITFGN